MGGKGTGVEIRGKAIRIQFSLNGEVVRRTLRRDGMAVPPSAENLGEATRLAAEIRSRIAAGTFCHSEYFPATSKDGRPLTVGKHLDAWLAVQRIEPSTAAAYASAVRFWKSAPCADKGSLLGERALHRLKASHVMRALTFRPGLNAKTVNNYTPRAAEQPRTRCAAAAACADAIGRRLRLPRPALRQAVDGGASLQAQLLGTNLESAGAALPASVQHSPQLRDDDADVRHDASILRDTTGALRRHAAEHLRPLARWGAQRHGDGPAGSVASTRSIPGFIPGKAPLAGYATLTAEGS